MPVEPIRPESSLLTNCAGPVFLNPASLSVETTHGSDYVNNRSRLSLHIVVLSEVKALALKAGRGDWYISGSINI